MDTARDNIPKYALGGQEDNFCRLCFAKAFKLRNVFPYGDDPNNELFRRVCTLALVRLDHKLEPDCCICYRCITQLEEFGKFQRQCVEYNQLLYQARGQDVPHVAAKSSSRFPLLQTQGSRTSISSKPDVDPFESSAGDFEGNGRGRKNKRRTLAPKRYSLTDKQKPGGKTAKKPKQEFDSEESFEEDASDSAEDYKPTKRKASTTKRSARSSVVSKKRGRRSKNESMDRSLSAGSETGGGSKRNRPTSKVITSTDFLVYNAGHGSINIMHDGYRYYKYRYYKTGSEVRYGWQCIEPDCPSQLYTSSFTKQKIYWRDRFYEHNHPSDNVDELMATKVEDTAQEDFEENTGDYELVTSGRGRHTYKLMKFSNGRETLIYGDHRHRLLVERADEVKIFGCTNSSCKSVVYMSKDHELRIYCGSFTSTEVAADSTYRKTSKVLLYEGHHFIYSGRRLENKNCSVYHCIMKKKLDCPSIIYCTGDDTIITPQHQVRLPHNHTPDVVKLEEDMVVVEAQKGTLPVESKDYHIAKNSLKTDFVIFEGIRYFISNTRVDGTKTCRCLESDNCAAYLFLIPNGTVVKYDTTDQHSHPLPDPPKSIYEFDYIIETQDVSSKHSGGTLHRWYKDYEYKRDYNKDPGFFYYRCVERIGGCAAAFITNEDFSSIRETFEHHNHPSPQIEKEQRKSLIQDDGTVDYTMETNVDGHDIMKYRGNRYCLFYIHKEGWHVWRCFGSTRCRATVFQDPASGKISDVEKIAHLHGPPKANSKNDESSITVKEEAPDNDSDSRESTDWFSGNVEND